MSAIAQALLAELQQEVANTRKLFEALPDDQWQWQPHEKSMTLSRLAGHVAETIGWTKETLQLDGLDMAAMTDYKPAEPKSRAELLELLDKCTQTATEVLKNTSDETFQEMWTFRTGDQVHFTLPKIAVMRAMVLNHHYHHRGQLTVYLRLLNQPLPGIYGPSADEAEMMAAAAQN